MARIRNGILGGFSGKVGEVIGQNYSGVSTMRAMPKYVFNPQTEAQQNHRKKLKTAAQFFAPAVNAFYFSQYNVSPTFNGFNNAVRDNFSCFDVDARGEITCDIDSLVLGEYIGVPFFDIRVSLGDVSGVENFLTVDLSWNDAIRPAFCHDNDKLIMFVATPLGQDRYTLLFGDIVDCTRIAESCKVNVPLPFWVENGQNLHFAFGGLSYSEEHVVYKSTADGGRRKGHNPQKPKEIINIPAKNIVTFSDILDYIIPLHRV